MNNNYPEELLPVPPKVELLGVMSAIIYASMPHKDNGYAVISAVSQAKELLNEVNKQQTK